MKPTREITAVEREWMGGTLIYLATPYTRTAIGFDAAADEAARVAARLALATNAAVFSPIVHGHVICRAGSLDPVKDSVAWAKLNARMVSVSDVLVIAHMDGWDESEGIADEIGGFLRAHKPIFDLVDVKNIKMIRRPLERPVRARTDDRPEEEIIRDHAEWFQGARA